MMIMRRNSSFLFLMDLRHLQADSQRNEMLAVGSEGVFPDLLLIFFMSFFAFFHNTPTPIFFPPLHICIQERQTLFILPSMLLHHFVSSVERWGQEAKSLTSFHATRMGENDKFMANKEVLSCKLK